MTRRRERPVDIGDGLPGQPIYPDERPDLYHEHWLFQMESLLRDWRRRREVLLGKEESGPLETDKFIKIRAAELNEPAPENLGARETVEWLYWRDVVDILQLQANISRLNMTNTAKPMEDNTLLADFNDYIADLLRGQLRGIIHPVFDKAKKSLKHSPRQLDAVAKAASAARLQVDEGIFRNVHDADMKIAGDFGISYSTFDKLRQKSSWRNLQSSMRRRMELHSDKADRSAFLLEVISKATDEFKEEEV